MTREAAIDTGAASVRFDDASGRFDIVAGAFRLEGLTSGFELADRKASGCELAWRVVGREEKRLRVQGENGGIVLALDFELQALRDAEGTRQAVTLQATVSSNTPFTLERIVIAQAERLPKPDHLLAEGRPTGAIDTRAAGAFDGARLMAWTRAGETLFLTFPVRQSFPCTVTGRIGAEAVEAVRVACAVGLDAIGAPIAAPPLTFCATDRPHAWIEAYGDRQRPVDAPAIRPAPVAWNSWDYIVNAVSEEYVLRNLACIAADPVLGKAVGAIVIDDGWEHLYGDWEPNHRFPGGMARVARRITEAGYQAGIWFAPAIVENCSKTAYWDDRLLACGRAGVPCLAYECMRRYGFVLDVRKREVRAWLHDLFRRYRDMGYSYFKVDFLRQLANAELFDGKRVPKGDLVRELLGVIRAAVGDECHILGCNFPSVAGPGLVDSNRIGGDIAPRFSVVRRNARSLATRYWQHRRLWWNDPDFAVCRGPETSEDPDLGRIRVNNIYVQPLDTHVPALEPFLSLRESRTLLSMVVLSGGSITLGDNLPALNEAGMALLRRTVSAEVGAAARPLDLFAADVPALWVQRLSRGHRVACVNWSDEPATHALDVGAVCGTRYPWATNFWTGARLPLEEGAAQVTLAPHETLLLELREP